ncbi:MAG: hypothetical protein ACP6IY_04010 [Promethearchaeia archaeon]
MKLFKKRINKILKNFSSEEIIAIDKFANFFGKESRSLVQIRGNGVLFLTNSKLIFELFLPKRRFEILINDILNIEVVKSHLKKTKLRPLLKVIFKNEREEIDSVAWLVKDLQLWKEKIKDLLKK